MSTINKSVNYTVTDTDITYPSQNLSVGGLTIDADGSPYILELDKVAGPINSSAKISIRNDGAKGIDFSAGASYGELRSLRLYAGDTSGTYLDSRGMLSVTSDGIAIGDYWNIDDAQLSVTIRSNVQRGFIVRGAASQSANLTEWQNSDGTSVASVAPDGVVAVNKLYLGGITILEASGYDVYLNTNAVGGTRRNLVLDNSGTIRYGGDVGLARYNAGNVKITDGADGFGGIVTNKVNLVNDTALSSPASGEIWATNADVSQWARVRAGQFTLNSGDPAVAVIAAQVQGEDIFTVDNVSDGRLRLDATGPHGQFIEIYARGAAGSPAINANSTLWFAFNGVHLLALTPGGSNTIIFEPEVGMCVKSHFASNIPLTVKGASSQTANLQEWQDVSGSPLSAITADGKLFIGKTSGANIGNGSVNVYAAEYSYVNLTNDTSGTGGIRGFRVGIEGSTNAGYIDQLEHAPIVFRTDASERLRITEDGAIIAKGPIQALFNSTAGDQIYLQNSDGSRSFFMGYSTSENMFLFVGSNNAPTVFRNNEVYFNTNVRINSQYQTYVPVIISGASSQTGNLTEWKDSTGNILTRVSSGGLLETASVETNSVLIKNGDNNNGLNHQYQLAFGFGGGSGYKHFIATRHNAGLYELNAFDFYTSNGDSAGAFTDAIHGMSINGGRVGVGVKDPQATLDVAGSGLALCIHPSDAYLSGQINFYTENLGAGNGINISTNGGTSPTGGTSILLWRGNSDNGLEIARAFGNSQITSGTAWDGSAGLLILNSRGVVISGGQAVDTPLSVKGSSEQSANLTEWKNSTGTNLSVIDASGALIFPGSSGSYGKVHLDSSNGHLTLGNYHGGGGQIHFKSMENSAMYVVMQANLFGATVYGGINWYGTEQFGIGNSSGNELLLFVNGSPSHALKILDGDVWLSNTKKLQLADPNNYIWRNNTNGDTEIAAASSVVISTGLSGGSNSIYLNPAGAGYTWLMGNGAYVQGNLFVANITTTNTSITVSLPIAETSFIVKGAASHTANLQEWRNSSGTVLAYVDSAGRFVGDGSLLTGISGGSVDWTSPGTIGSTTPNTGAFTTLSLINTSTAKAKMSSPADGVLLLVDNAGTSFGRINFGGSTSSYPALKRNAAAINIRLADDSAAAALSAGAITGTALVSTSSLFIANASPMGWTSGSHLKNSGDGIIAIYNALENSFGRLQFGGTTASFPSIKRNSAALDIRLADDSNYAALNSGALTLNAVTAATVPFTVKAAASQTGNLSEWQNGSGSPIALVTKDGDIELPNSGQGVILKDRTSGTRYRLKVDGGVLSVEVAS